MEIPFKWLSFYFCLFCFQLCNGKPITSDDKEIDFHSKLLTGTVSLLLTVCCLVFLAACLCCQRRKSFEVQDPEKKFRNSPVVSCSLSDIDHGHVNPIANGEFTIFSPLSVPHINNNIFHAKDEIKATTVGDSVQHFYDIKSWFNPNEKDFPRNKLKYIRELGMGWFGKVVQGAAQDLNDAGQSWSPVVVRILEATSSQKEKILFLQEAAIYRCSNHTNILSLVGRSLETVPFLLLQEYCPQGDLKKYLQSNKSASEKLLTTEYPLIWCCQLTSALKHLHENNIIHLDLAARNCQLTSNLTLKLGDYGLSPFRYPADYYQGLPSVPVRWCAPESLICTQTTIQPKKITPEANVWSLGVTMWEICECGEQPYKTLNDDEVISQVLGLSNVRLGRPTYSALYTDYIFRLMQSCWTSTESRATVSQIDIMLTDLLQVHRNTTHTLDVNEFDRRWESCKPNTIVKTDHITEPLLTPEISLKKYFSPSLTNLHGSLDNLADYTQVSTENETKNDSLTSHKTSVSDSSDQEQCLKQTTEFNASSLYQRALSSGSETEDENWRNKVERGAYTEKVRQKSRSVTDLMVLTHVDYSESESETPLPSLDYRVNYKNVRLAGLEGSNNLENANLTFGSEGNLLSVQDTFQEELKKLQEERRDSLLFVPDTVSQNSFSSKGLSSVASPSKLMQELNSSIDIKPAKQVFNVYNVTIDNFSPMKVHNKLEEIIDFKSEFDKEMRGVDCKNLLNINNESESCDNLNKNICIENKTEILKNPIQEVCEKINLVTDVIKNYTYLKLAEHEVENKCIEIKPDINISDNTSDQIFRKKVFQKTEFEDTESVALKEVTPQVESHVRTSSVEVAYEILESIILNITSAKEKNNIHNEIKDNTENMDKCSNIQNTFIIENDIIKEESTKEIKEGLNHNSTFTKVSSLNEDNQIDKPEITYMKQIPKLSEIILSNKNLPNFRDKTTTQKVSKNDDEINNKEQMVNFDLSLDQKEAMPNSLTHLTVFTSTPFRKTEMPLEDKFSSLNLFSSEGNDTDRQSSPDCIPLNYSLETWDNFLGTILDTQNEHTENMFDSFSSEPQSLLFIEGEKCDINNQTQVLMADNPKLNATYNLNGEINKTYNLDDKNDSSLDGINVGNNLNSTYSKKDSELSQYNSDASNVGSFENGSGWFLHPQPTNDLCGDIQIQSPSTDSYIGFGIDDEIMSAIRNELLSKLPHAQGANADRFKEEEDWDTSERNEVFLRYNVYNHPLSPIPEEGNIEDELKDTDLSSITSLKQEREYEDVDWSGRTDSDTLTHDIDSNSAHTLESPHRGQFNRHTPSQDSCCSNDTLFNLEELICATTELEKDSDLSTNIYMDMDKIDPEKTFVKDSSQENVKEYENTVVESCEIDTSNKTFIHEFLTNERDHSSDSDKFKKPTTLNINIVSNKQIVPLPSPEDNPRKQLPASLLNFKNVTAMNCLSLEENSTEKIIDNSQKMENSDKESLEPICETEEDSLKSENEISEEQNMTYIKEEPDILKIPEPATHASKVPTLNSLLSVIEYTPQENSDKEIVEPVYQNSEMKEHLYENERKMYDNDDECNLYETSDVKNNEILYENTDINSYEDYVNIVNMENDKNRLESDIDRDTYINIYGHEDEVHSEDDNIYGILTDIRFTGPTDSQMMTTSFSENIDEQGWESGSDSRSSSSGEFIWKEGEHEESLKALIAVPQDVLETIKPMEGIAEDVFEESDVSSSLTDDEETPEFVPSAWDKFAIPIKSALRSPEKTLNKTEERKSKGVWFKKQKYHCIYEYPKEPESPVLQSQDLWKPQTDIKSFTDWEFDGETFVPSQTNDELTNYNKGSNSISSNQSLYHLTSITDFIPENSISTTTDGEFFISSSTEPFHSQTLSSQFFPGNSNWTFENATPDSGVEDVTPGSISDSNEFDGTTSVLTLKQLATDALPKKKLSKLKNNQVMGGLRHTRDKLKLDLPPSPSAFTSDKRFTIEPTVEHVIREKPAFTTFGKSRFMVQHVDTPPDESNAKNVSFEALPYQPFNPIIMDHTDSLKGFDVIERSLIKNEDDKYKLKVEVVRGEASLLDSGDEDSGIESASTLERKIANSQL